MTDKGIIYLDYNATAPIRPEVIEVMVEIMEEGGNPSSIHSAGRKAKSRMEQARLTISEIIKCRSQMIVLHLAVRKPIIWRYFLLAVRG